MFYEKVLYRLIAIITSITISAFTANFSIIMFMDTADPTSAYIVSEPYNWSTCGSLYGICDELPEDLACTIKVISLTMQRYYHLDINSCKILNHEKYARDNFDMQNPTTSPRFIEIPEQLANPRYKIQTIVGKKLEYKSGILIAVNNNDVNIQKQKDLSSGVDLAYWNARH